VTYPDPTAYTSDAREPAPHFGLPLGVLSLLAIAIMMPVTLPVPVLRELVLQRFEVSELLTSLFMSINMLGALLAAPLAGALADRVGRSRPLLIGALLLDAICLFAMTAPVSFPIFLAIRFVEGCAHISALSILLMLASRALPEAQRGRAMGIVGGSMMLGVAIGAPVGGIIGNTNVLLPLYAGGALSLTAAILSATLVRETLKSERRPSFREIRSALRSHPSLAIPLAFAFTDRFTVGFFTTTFSLYLRRIFDLSPAEIGISIAIFMLPFALFSYPFGRLAERGSIMLMLCGGSALYGIGTSLVGFTSPPELNFLMFAIGITAAVMFVPSMVMTSQLAPKEIRATAMGAFNAAGSLGFIVGPVTGGAVSELVSSQHGWPAGYRAAFVVAGAAELLCVAVALPWLLRLRRQGRAF
jgi:MFS family permease